MTYFKTALLSSAVALMATACATKPVLDDSQRIGITDNDQFETMGGEGMDELDPKFKVGVNDGDGMEATVGGEADMDGDKAMMSKSNVVMVGGDAMYPNKTIVENASNASELTTLVAAVSQAGLVETLSGDGPFTVFAPTNTAFNLVGGDTVANLMKDENKEQLTKVLTAHVVPGKIDATTLMGLINSNGGSYSAQTVSGDTLTFYVMNDAVKVADESGRLATVTTADVMQSNGIVHVVNSVLIPK